MWKLQEVEDPAEEPTIPAESEETEKEEKAV